MKTILLVNAKASKAGNRQKLIERSCKRIKFDCDFIYIKDPKELKSICKKIYKANPDLVIIGGGDGTVISVTDHLLNLGYKNNFAILPLGTANYLARNLNMPLDIKKALNKIKNGKVKKINLAEANNDMFSLIADIGITAKVSENVNDRYKKVLGQGAYIIEGFKQLFKHDAFEYTITLDEDKKVEGTAHQIVVLNADLNMQLSLAPKNNISDQDIKVAVYGDGISLLKLLIYTFLYIVSFGRIKKAINSYEVKQALIETRPQKKYSLDGEMKSNKPLNVKVSKTKIKFIH